MDEAIICHATVRSTVRSKTLTVAEVPCTQLSALRSKGSKMMKEDEIFSVQNLQLGRARPLHAKYHQWSNLAC